MDRVALGSRIAWPATLSLPLLVLAACGTGPTPTPSTESAATPAPALAPLTRLTLAYGTGPDQVGDLMLPDADGPAPVAVLIHGGFWLEPFKRELMTPLAMDLSSRGFATWNIEYRRVGASGGGWPRTAEDVAAGIDFLTELATAYALDLDRVALLGHSAGGHLALWAGARHRLPPGAPGAGPRITPAYVVSQAGVADLEAADRAGLGRGAVADFLGRDVDRAILYQVASPMELLPLGVPQLLVHGLADGIVPLEQSTSYAAAAQAAGDIVELLSPPGVDHFQLIDASSSVWAATAQRISDRLLLARP